MNVYPYRFKQRILNKKGKLKETIQFVFDVPVVEGQEKIEYLINFYPYNDNLYINDFFPADWEEQKNRVNKLWSAEHRKALNFRKITTTCFTIFDHEIQPANPDAVLIINGSLTEGEQILDKENVSRKTKLYRMILTPILQSRRYKIVDIPQHHVFAIIKNKTTKSDASIRQAYDQFKKA